MPLVLIVVSYGLMMLITAFTSMDWFVCMVLLGFM
uniref:Uncharacterized protein n=1 Tax=Rhizophora mucronata TaxID=61149 RepID=A0A2P2N485_RHIMU